MKTRVGKKLQATVVSKGDSKTRSNAASILHSDMKSSEMAAIKVLLQLHCWRRRRTLGLLVSALLSMSIAGVHVAGQCPVRQDFTRDDTTGSGTAWNNAAVGHGSLASLHAHANAQQLVGIRS